MPLKAVLASLLLAILSLAMAVPAGAQSRRLSHCIAIADAAPGIEYIQPATWRDPVPDGAVRIGYIGHSMFLIRTGDGLSIVTDYNGYLGPTTFLPDVATMNRAHSSHWTDGVEGIGQVLRGWSDSFGLPADHHLELGDVLIRNVTSDIRSFGTVEENGNSIFVFEAAGLCIAHLGHLHQELNEAQYAALGRVDVLMVPVDGSYTMDLGTMMRVVSRLRSSLVLPMHWFSEARLGSFLSGMSGQFLIERAGASEITVSPSSLPRRPTVLVLEPRPLED
ncbi:MBL fold metallo-hydrolase [Paracoccus marinaquae]|uniref:MBL fold metallo-hydrolase n=1 Tax=Paracoccus marinaquae TaxID=2841926 RepID=A0ABS6AHE3_9RHOB|nr:MBL fold metallo-hydrolase [Paracoccus marinaquae]MBU3029347.1 MBL fold metallo-hydrolase [Paracoccus marinaquae]